MRPQSLVIEAAFLIALIAPLSIAADNNAMTQRLGSGVTISIPDIGKPASGVTYQWPLELTDDQQTPVSPLSLVFEADMPGHGHGLPEPPVVEPGSVAGSFLVKNIRFNMGGDWRIRVWVGSTQGQEPAIFNIRVGPAPTFEHDGLLSQAEKALIKTLTLDAISPMAPDPTNHFSNNAVAIRLGERMFFDTGLSGSGNVACATCHQPEKSFTDGLPVSRGSAELTRNAPGLLGVRHNHWFYWDGRRDSLWAQALTPLETRGEMDGTRTDVVRHVVNSEKYGKEFLVLTGQTVTFSSRQRFPLGAGPFAPERAGRDSWQAMTAIDRERVNTAFADVGKLLAAYQETLSFTSTPFDSFAQGLAEASDTENRQLTEAQYSGLKLYLDAGRTHCLRCHNGPLLTNQGFHAIGSQTSFIDLGRQLGLDAARVDPFNCTGAYSDSRSDCRLSQLIGIDAGAFAGAFKVPTLRNLTQTAPYFHDGRYANLEQVIEFYRHPPGPENGNHELPPLDLTDDEAQDLIAFLKSLSASEHNHSSIAR